VQYASRTLTAVEQRYSNTEWELLAILWAVTTELRLYTEYREFTVFTDHQALIERPNSFEKSKSIVRLWLKHSKFHITVRPLAGVENAASDVLRR
jgi:RNase H-like domain found in reverse transcriptase